MAVAELATHVGVTSGCEVFALERGVLYRDRSRHCRDPAGCASPLRPRPPLAFSGVEPVYLLGVLDRERFADMAPASADVNHSTRCMRSRSCWRPRRPLFGLGTSRS